MRRSAGAILRHEKMFMNCFHQNNVSLFYAMHYRQLTYVHLLRTLPPTIEVGLGALVTALLRNQYTQCMCMLVRP